MSNLSKKEINEVLNELKNVRPEQLTGEAKKLFEAIMKIADERDEFEYKYNRAIEDLVKLEKERQADKEKIKEYAELLIKVNVQNLNNSIEQRKESNEQLEALHEGWKIELEEKDNRIKELEKERQADKEKIKELEDKLNEEAYIRVSAGAHNRICELEKENKRLYEENQIYALEGSRVRLQIHIEKNYIPKVKVIEALQHIEDYFDRLNVTDEDIEFIQSIEEELLKDGGE